MKVLVACTLPEFALSELRTLGTELVVRPELTSEQLAAQIGDAAILIVDRRRVPSEAVAAGRALQMIVRAGTVVSNIALEEASSRGVFVVNCPGNDGPAIAELMLGLAVALDRRLLDNARAASEGRTPAPELLDARGLAGRTLGILGYTSTSRHLVRRARGLEMNVLAWSATVTTDESRVRDLEFCAWPRELAARSDVVTVFGPPEGTETVLVNSEFVQSMRPGALLVHVGHPGVLDELAIAAAVRAGKLRVAADVYGSESPGEPPRIRSRLVDVPGVLLTQRLGGSTEQARHAIAAEVVRIVRQFLLSGEVLNCVNLLERSPATWQLVLRLRDTVGVMAAVMDCIRADGVNAEEISSRVFRGARAAACTISLAERPSTEAVEAIRRLDGVLHLHLRALV